MFDLVEQIGPYLGVAAFVALAVLAFLIFQQAREIRRLREWAGRAPERAGEAAEASLATADARGEMLEQEATARGGQEGRLAGVRARLAGGYDSLDRTMPFNPRYLLVALAAAAVAAAVLTSGFGLLSTDEGSGGRGGGGKAAKREKPKPVEVAVLNATQERSEVTGVEIEAVEGLASKVSEAVVRPADFKVVAEDNAPSGFEQTTVMFDTERGDAAANEDAAARLAEEAAKQLGEMPVEEMTGEVRAATKGATVALVIGADDSEF